MNCTKLKSERRRRRGTIAARTRRLRPTVMALEGRELLSTIVVNNPTDTPVANQIDLRQAIAQANSDGGGDTIVFSSLFDTPQTITLSGGQLELTGTKARTTIQGPGRACWASAATMPAGYSRWMPMSPRGFRA